MRQPNEDERAAILQELDEQRARLAPHVRRQEDAEKRGRCPRCANTQGFKSGGASLRGRRHYDIYSDTAGVMRCPACQLRAQVSAFYEGS